MSNKTGWLVFLLVSTGGPALAQGAGIEDARMICDLTGDCADTGSSGPAATDGVPRRSGATRGFTFGRAVGSGLGEPSAARPPSIAAPRETVQPRRIGRTDLRLTFATNSATLDAASRAKLARLAVVLDTPRLKARRLRIEGHTDSSGNAAVNRDLSRQRAQSAANALTSAGLARQRLDVVGYGADSPLPGVAASAGANRRVMAILLD
jgi:outer membrane protein OmpA-like peptidoglycan-associated protein